LHYLLTKIVSKKLLNRFLDREKITADFPSPIVYLSLLQELEEREVKVCLVFKKTKNFKFKFFKDLKFSIFIFKNIHSLKLDVEVENCHEVFHIFFCPCLVFLDTAFVTSLDFNSFKMFIIFSRF